MENLNQVTKSASALLNKYLMSVNAGDAKVTASFFAPEGYIDAPYMEALGMPAKIIGMDAIEGTMSTLRTIAPNFNFTRISILMETENEAIAEYESEAVLANGRNYKQLYIGHLTSKDGKILCHKEYLNTIVFAQAFLPNGLNDLITNK